MGFGQNVARQMNTLSSEYNPFPNTSIAQCPESWITADNSSTVSTTIRENSLGKDPIKNRKKIVKHQVLIATILYLHLKFSP